MDFFGQLGASTREALGWESKGELDDAAWTPPMLSYTVVHALLRGGLATVLEHTVSSGEGPVEAFLGAGMGDEWDSLAGAAVEWSCSHKDGKYAHEGTVELPLSAPGGVSATATTSDAGTSYTVRYAHPEGHRAAQVGFDVAAGAVEWESPQRLPYAAGWRHGPLAAGLRGAVMTGGATTVLAPALRLGFDDKTVSAHIFAEGQPYTSVGGCCQWRPSFTPSIEVTCGLNYAVDRTDGRDGHEYSLTVDEGVFSVQYQVDQSLSTQLRVRRCFGVDLVERQSAAQYHVQKKLADGFAVGLVWQSPLSSLARFHTHSVGFSIAGG